MRGFLVDSLTALVVFTTLAAASEYFIAGMTLAETATARAIMAPVILGTGRPYGVWRDWITARFPASGAFGAAIVDLAAFLSFQVPVYVAILIAAGADLRELVLAAGSATFFMMLIARPYGLLLDRVRGWFRLVPGHPETLAPGCADQRRMPRRWIRSR